MAKPLLGITIGDAAGVGPEVVLKATMHEAVFNRARIVILGSVEVLEYYRSLLGLPVRFHRITHVEDARSEPGNLSVLEVGRGPSNLVPGIINAEAGHLAIAALNAGAQLCKDSLLDGMVTAPTNKKSFHLAGYNFEGQTELLGEAWGSDLYTMLVVADRLRVLLLTRHMSLREALDRINTSNTLSHLLLLNSTLKRLGIAQPRIALAAWNPHAGEGGIFGNEDDQILVPAVVNARKLGIDVAGPVPADSLFNRAYQGEFDGILSLYHDQALIAPKALAPERAVTLIAGVPFLRVSVIHGAGFDRAGQNKANATNMTEAIARAAEWAPMWKLNN
ncbi:MAG: 4-hydroxythreonine-4-phosphate dehydrogenase PdxA [Planctomycetota bacterium]